MRLLIAGICFLTLAALGCGQKKEAGSKTEGDGDGVVGVSCNVQPIVRDRANLNVCSWPAANWPGLERGTFFYAGANALNAADQAVKACHDANALDEGVAFGTSCFHLCEKVVHCLGGTPNP